MVCAIAGLGLALWRPWAPDPPVPTPSATETLSLPTTGPTTKPTAEPTVESPTTQPTPGIIVEPPGPGPTGGGSGPPPSGYERERLSLSEYELEINSHIAKGDCFDNPPEEIGPGVVFTPVPCSQPHTDQAMGYVDLSEGMPEFGTVEFEYALARRCNSLKAAIGVPEAFAGGVSIHYPDEADWNQGARVALCWVPVFDKVWTGSVFDGTARFV
jgi:hypothetical protein